MTENTQLITVIARKEFPGSFTALLLEHDIIEIEWDPDLIEVQKHHVTEIKQAIMELGGGKRMRVYVSTNSLMHISAEARKYAVSNNGQELTLVNGVLINTLAKRLLFSFFVNVYRPKIPIKSFNSREEALTWLKNYVPPEDSV